MILALTITVAAGCGPADRVTDPGSAPRPNLEGSIYVLEKVNGLTHPFLVSDYTYAGDGTRTRFWILADTLRFEAQGDMTRLRLHRQLNETPGYPADNDEWTSYRRGLYDEIDDRVHISWNFLAVPVPVAGSDTLHPHTNGLVMRVRHPGTCFGCNNGPVVEYLYVRR